MSMDSLAQQIDIIWVQATSASQTSKKFRPGMNGGRFGLSIHVNHGTGTQTLAGSFKFQQRNKTLDPFGQALAYVDHDLYTFPTGPAGALWTFSHNFEAEYMADMILVFTRTGGTGDIYALLNMMGV